MKNIKKIDSITKFLIIALVYLTSVFTVITCNGQERVYELEKIIFKKVNEFRVSEGLSPVKWNDKVYDAANHHALYISKRGIQVSHYEIESVYDKENFVEMRRAQDRIKHYYHENAYGIECIADINFVWYKGDLEKIAEWTVNAWINSPDHRKGLLFESPSGTSLKFGAVSVLKVVDIVKSGWARPVLVLVN